MNNKLTTAVLIGATSLGLAACGSSRSTMTTVVEAAPPVSSSTSAAPTPQPTQSSVPTPTSSGPCDGHPCIGDWEREQAEGGTVVQCQDETWSHAGGISGACSDHGGESDNAGAGQSDPAAARSTSSSQPTPAPAPATAAPSVSSWRSCDQNISANSETSCSFALNTFYEYWEATGGTPPPGEQLVEVWSPSTGRDYTQTCTNEDPEIDCTHGTGDQVQFSEASVLAYTPAAAAAYAASGTLGP